MIKTILIWYLFVGGNIEAASSVTPVSYVIGQFADEKECMRIAKDIIKDSSVIAPVSAKCRQMRVVHHD